ncbi:MAG TPA: TerC family protein [Symbiobacteriaceae bacterium]
MTTTLLWIIFAVIVIGVMALDLGIFDRHAHVVSTKEAAMWTGVWVSLALLFNLGIYFFMGQNAALEFLTGYLIEYSLSVDNIFVFIMLFSYFAVEPQYRHRVLFWGIIGALVFRGLLIGVGSALISRFHWILYLFGAFLLFTAAKMALQKQDDEPDPEKNPVVNLFKQYFPVTEKFHGEHFFTRLPNGKLVATPLFITLLVIETTDIMFALDSIPAIFAVTQNSFIVFTSNVFAIMGLRSLYFLLDGIMGLFRYLKYGLSVILGFIGAKMLISSFVEIPTALSLGVVIGVLAISILASVLIPDRQASPTQHD